MTRHGWLTRGNQDHQAVTEINEGGLDAVQAVPQQSSALLGLNRPSAIYLPRGSHARLVPAPKYPG